ncbi:DUF2380 domain-containing protein [Chthonobacter rhizosphaerae]|uniref:DUF2380 domain-containing protein n=1 Tax=Chthonobacter rhizosphaerae TaxID=2735553 RepID=UPI0015EEC04C
MTRFPVLAAIAFAAGLAAPHASAEPRRVILLDTQYEAEGAGETDETRAADLKRVEMIEERLKAHVAAATADYAVVENEAVSAEINDYNLGSCGRCELALGRKAGADFVMITTVQKVSSILINLQVFVYSVADGSTVAAGGTVLHANTDADWRRGIDSIARNRLNLPKPPA